MSFGPTVPLGTRRQQNLHPWHVVLPACQADFLTLKVSNFWGADHSTLFSFCSGPVRRAQHSSNFAKELIQNDLAYVCEPQNSNDLSSTICLALHDGRTNSIKRIKYVRDSYSKEKLLQKYNDVFQLASQ